jgi:hypothetical protein
VDNWSASLEAVTFQWQSVPGAATYRVETRSDRQGQTKWQNWGPTTGTSLIVRYSDHGDYFSIPGTVYYWRVVALDTAGRPGHYSAERRFIFSRMETPVPPTKTPKPPPTDTPEPPPTDTPEPPPPTNTPVPPTTMPGA